MFTVQLLHTYSTFTARYYFPWKCFLSLPVAGCNQIALHGPAYQLSAWDAQSFLCQKLRASSASEPCVLIRRKPQPTMEAESVPQKKLPESGLRGKGERGRVTRKMARKMKQEERLMEAGSEKYSIRTCRPDHITLCYCTSCHYPNLLLKCWHLSSLCRKMV